MSDAIVMVRSEPLSDSECEILFSFRTEFPDFSFFLIRLGNLHFKDTRLFDRSVSLPLTEAEREIALCMGVQIAFNEGFGSVGMLHNVAALELGLSLRLFLALRRRESDVFIVSHQSTPVSSLYVSHRAAFVVSFWGALSAEMKDHRVDVIRFLVRFAKRKLKFVNESVEGTRETVQQSHEGSNVLAKHAPALARLIGFRNSQFRAPKTNPVNRVAVVTPYFKEPADELARCLDSVRNQSYPCHHFVVSDGFPSDVVERYNVTHIELGIAHSDNGNTPRYVGGLVALARGFDAVAYLDADNWLEKDHLKTLVETQHHTQANCVCSLRNTYLPDGYMLPESGEEDLLRLHVDTSCYFITRDVEFIAHLWGQMPQMWSPLCDRIVFSALEGQLLAWTNQRTLNFKSNYSGAFRRAGRPIPEKVNDPPPDLIRRISHPDASTVSMAIRRMGRMISIKKSSASVRRLRGQHVV